MTPFFLQRPWLAHVFHRRRGLVRIFFLAATLIGSTGPIPLAAEEPSVARQAPRFELTLKRQTFRYLPYEYTSLTQISSYGSVYEPALAGDLQQNDKVIVPASLSCEDCIPSWRLEASYYEIELAAPNVYVLRTMPTGATLSRQYLNPTARSEAAGSAMRRFSLSSRWQLHVGAGIQNINKYTYGYNGLSGSAYEEHFFTYGGAAHARLNGMFTESFSMAVQTKLFYTTGTRFSDNLHLQPGTVSFPPGAALTISAGTAHARGIFRGAGLDASLGYKFFDRFQLRVGYDYVYSYFSLLHNREMRITFPLSGTPTASYPPRNGNHDIVRGLYTAVSFSF